MPTIFAVGATPVRVKDETTPALGSRKRGSATFMIRTSIQMTAKITRKPPMLMSQAASRSFRFALLKILLFIEDVCLTPSVLMQWLSPFALRQEKARPLSRPCPSGAPH